MNTEKREVAINYTSPYPESIKFEIGEKVRIIKKFDEDAAWDNWYWCFGEQGNKAWVPKQYIDFNGDKGIINTPYDAKELIIHAGEILETIGELNGFTIATNLKGETGWVPLKNLK